MDDKAFELILNLNKLEAICIVMATHKHTHNTHIDIYNVLVSNIVLYIDIIFNKKKPE